jgi:hypothetical protein
VDEGVDGGDLTMNCFIGRRVLAHGDLVALFISQLLGLTERNVTSIPQFKLAVAPSLVCKAQIISAPS